MTQIILLFSLFFTSLTLLAQNPEIEQLQKQIADHPHEDTFKVNRWNLLASNVEYPNEKRILAAQEALVIANKIKYIKGQYRAHNSIGAVYYIEGKYKEAENKFMKALQIAKENNLQNEMMDFMINIYLTKTSSGDLDSAIVYIKMAEETAKELGDKERLARIQNENGVFYTFYKVDLPKAVESLIKSIKTAEEINCTSCLTASWMEMGGIYIMLGDYKTALSYYKKLEELNNKMGIKSSSTLYNYIGELNRLMGNYKAALENYDAAIANATDSFNSLIVKSNIADVYVRMDSIPKAFEYAYNVLDHIVRSKQDYYIAWIYGVLSRAHLKSNHLDSAYYYSNRGLEMAQSGNHLEFIRDGYEDLSKIYAEQQAYKKAYDYYQQYIFYRDSMVNQNITSQTNLMVLNYETEKTQSQIDKLEQQKKDQRYFLIGALIGLGLILSIAIILLRNNRQKQKANRLLQQQKAVIDAKANELTEQKFQLEESYNNVETLSEIGRKISSSLTVEDIIRTVYKNVNNLMDASIFGIGIYNDGKKTIDFPATYENGTQLPAYSNDLEDKNRFASVCFTEGKEIVMGNLDEEYEAFVQKLSSPRQGEQPASLIFLPLIIKDRKAGVITVQSLQKNAYSDYHLYMLRNIAIYTAIALENAESFETLNQTVKSLKATQAQLVQSEKMASLGELTAGIAHEIQNPLNFVNNFSDVNTELVNELLDEIGKGNMDEVKSLAHMIAENEQKISMHGKRADSIVKGMLQHSRSSTGQKEDTDINAIADEYLRLSYHGIRAKDKSFNATMETDFDTEIGKINLVPQDMGRVLLNLINNAFYAVTEKKQSLPSDSAYKPTVKVRTKKYDDFIEITVSDNGNGIPKYVMEKIFQPFFTTKPSGEGTGLGLSMSYDIIKAHAGILTVETKEKEGSDFIIQLPIQQS